jgi:NodT family efflux transporter outer membrane factor (OMF) lipoprotein
MTGRDWWTRGAALGALFLVAGCDLAPRFKVPTTEVPVSYTEASHWVRSTPEDAAPRGAWWTAFGDPELNRLESAQDATSPTLAAAIASYDQARAFAAEAESGLFPTIGLGAQINTDRQSARRPRRRPGEPNQYLNNAIDTQTQYEIDFWGRIANTIRAGKAVAEESQADLETTRLSLHAELATDYVTLAGLDAELRLLGRTVDTYSQALQLTRNRFLGKIASETDVSRAATQLDTARAALADTLSRRALMEHAIALLMGQPPELFHIAEIPRLPEIPTIDEGLPTALLQRRPDISAAERQMAAANYQIGVTRAAFYPNISLNAILGLNDTGFDMFMLRDSFWALGPGLALPLFEGGLRHAELRAAIAAWRITAANYRETVLNAFTDVEDQAALLHYLGAEQTDELQAVHDAGMTLNSAMALYKDGANSYLEVVTAQVDQLNAQRASLDLDVRRLDATVGLIRALGGGWSATRLAPLRNGPGQ